MEQEIIKRLGANFISGTDEVIEDLISDFMSIASDCTNRSNNDSKLYPYVKQAVISEYNKRGAEGLLSKSEGGQSSSFLDIEEKLRKDLISHRLRRVK